MAAKHTIAFLTGIESISRKFAPRTETCANVSSKRKIRYKWLGSGVRYMATKDLDTHAVNFLVVRKNPRTTDITENEVNARLKFTSCRASVKARMKNLTTITADQEAFLAQKNNANGIKSFYAYIWSLESAAWDQLHPQG